MSSRTPYARIAITLPEADLAAADRLAKQQDRSRSWIVAEAVRRYAAEVEQGEPADALGSSRRAQLLRDVAMTAEERVHEAEETSRVSEQVTAPRTFASFDEFLAWQRAGGGSA
ncbi:ribbon-helix-helix protein, CopG family [Gemmatimonas sp.]|uniref:ribbon-helix-helix protein, CopG family n=1 Tax=Gemmatimonas sp. TaxID=1962908 RepID=UPI00286D7431|nr:ribbon-helix-helix protein, CopG family [Gemmatimonas sp.]